jgi:hypothetical protein
VKTVCGLTAANYLFVLSTAGLRMESSVETIYYQVAGVDSEGNMSMWSETQSFELQIGETTAAITDTYASNFTIFPNPSENSITIQGLKSGLIEIYNVFGVVVLIEPILSSTHLINHNLPTGIYTLKVGTHVVKLVVE